MGFRHRDTNQGILSREYRIGDTGIGIEARGYKKGIKKRG